MKPTPRSTWPGTLTSLTASGSVGAPGLVETPSGPLRYVATGAAPPVGLSSWVVSVVRLGDSVRSVELSPSVAPGSVLAGVVEPMIEELVGCAIRPAGRSTLSIGSP